MESLEELLEKQFEEKKSFRLKSQDQKQVERKDWRSRNLQIQEYLVDEDEKRLEKILLEKKP